MKALPKPVGSEEDLEAALQFLKTEDGDVPAFARYFVVDVAHGILKRPEPNARSPRLADDLKTLAKIRDHVALLNDEIGSLSSVSQSYLGRAVPNDAFGERNGRVGRISKLRLLLNDLEEATAAAETSLRKDLGEDRGGRKITTHWLAFGNPHAYFIARLIDLYVDVHGLKKLTATIASGRGRSCYEFVNAVHRYALAGC